MKTRFFWFSFLVSFFTILSIVLILYFQNNLLLTFSEMIQIIAPVLLIAAILIVIFTHLMWRPVDDFMEGFSEYTDIEKDSMVHILQRIHSRYEKTITEKQIKLNTLMDLLNHLEEGVLIIDQDEKVFFHNYAAASILQFSLQGNDKKLWEVIRSTDLMERIRKTIHEKQTFQGEERLIAPLEIHILYKIIPLQELSKEADWKALLFIRNITNIRKLEKVRSDFVANVSHELKSPLTAMLGYSEILAGDDPIEPSKQKRYSSIIHHNVLRLIEIVDDLLLLSKIETGASLQKTTFSIQELLMEIEELFKQKMMKKKIQFQIELNISNKMIYADKLRIRQMLNNLVDNAIKFTQENGVIFLIIQDDKEGIIISVKDNGVGIPFADQERIFERFYQVDKARSSDSEGTGLGLSIVRHIAEQHQGKVMLESQLGKGSVFSVFLPQPIQKA